jgi:nitrogen fixation/metabolism regulation signal transduction histidine kinase
MALYAVSSFIIAALLVFGLTFLRTLVRLWAERSKEQLGARFKTKMVVGAMALSLLPVVFMFFVSYSLLNRTLGRWFRANAAPPDRFRQVADSTPEGTRAPRTGDSIPAG